MLRDLFAWRGSKSRNIINSSIMELTLNKVNRKVGCWVSRCCNKLSILLTPPKGAMSAIFSIMDLEKQIFLFMET